ncbi:unnamed protein product [Timema podura]|uniref:Calcineurin-like phosphoesterase domain-containing protein n=1 Tax=Timema podura TaxID=61482 RepID=A0ABN7NXD6_TIMPD|nr:unnamed protein product [Timema podura]
MYSQRSRRIDSSSKREILGIGALILNGHRQGVHQTRSLQVKMAALNASLEVRQAGRRTLNTLSGSAMGVSTVTILHYNDVYNVEPRVVEPVGGAARFCAAIKTFSHLNPLVLFSGDIFSPSMLSTFTKGEQMVSVLNECGTHCAVFGNHDFVSCPTHQSKAEVSDYKLTRTEHTSYEPCLERWFYRLVTRIVIEMANLVLKGFRALADMLLKALEIHQNPTQ